MILSNTVTSAAVQGNTVSAAADDNPILGFGAVGNGRNWVGSPGAFNAAISALGTLVTGTNIIDWTTAGYFTSTAYGGAFTLSFTNASNVLTPSLGQTIVLVITGAGSASATWPSTISWVGVGASGSGVHAAPTLTSVTTIVYLTCTGVGASPTYTGLYVTG